MWLAPARAAAGQGPLVPALDGHPCSALSVHDSGSRDPGAQFVGPTGTSLAARPMGPGAAENCYPVVEGAKP